ncbi:MAG TPA: glycosyltransferase family 4 protein [Gaiellaceae bacterium]|nr:glycosyltransferase family 4 protein [Gaiellaceae bacterium]
MADRLRVLVAGWLNSPHVVSWAAGVAEAGHEVHLVGRPTPQWPPVKPGATVHVLRSDGLPLVRSLRMSTDLARVAATVEPDLVHAHWLPEFGWMAAREHLAPLICSAWGSDVFGVSGLGRRRSLRALRAADVVLADSEDLARATRALGGPAVRVEVARWGLDLDRYSPGEPRAARRSLGLPEDEPLVLSVRGFGQIYNPLVLVEAIALLRRPARLVFKHPGGQVPDEVERAIERLGLRDRVTVIGNLDADRMPDVYRAASIVVSLASTDSSPRSVWEALACGRPVVVSDLAWARDELAPPGAAELVAIEPAAVAEAIARTLDDGAGARTMAEQGRALALANLDPSTCAARIDALYREIAA